MKTGMKVAIGGLLALCLNINVSAHAQQASLAKNAYSAIQYNQVAKQFVQQLEQSTGVQVTSAAALDAAVAKLGAAERASVISAINSYAAKAVNPNGNSSAISQNEQAARAAFMVNGQLKSVGAVAANSATRDSATGKALENVGSCDGNLPNVLAKKSGRSVNEVKALLDEGIIVAAGNCGQEIIDVSDEADKHLVEMAIYARAAGIRSAAEDQKDGIYAAGLKQAFAKDGVMITDADALSRASGVRKDCAWIR